MFRTSNTGQGEAGTQQGPVRDIKTGKEGREGGRERIPENKELQNTRLRAWTTVGLEAARH